MVIVVRLVEIRLTWARIIRLKSCKSWRSTGGTTNGLLVECEVVQVVGLRWGLVGWGRWVAVPPRSRGISVAPHQTLGT